MNRLNWELILKWTSPGFYIYIIVIHLLTTLWVGFLYAKAAVLKLTTDNEHNK